MKLGKQDHVVPKCHCLACLKPLDGAMGVGHENAPAAGDVSVCIHCAHVMLFTHDHALRNLTDDEAQVLDDPNVIRARELILSMQQARKAR